MLASFVVTVGLALTARSINFEKIFPTVSRLEENRVFTHTGNHLLLQKQMQNTPKNYQFSNRKPQ